MKKGLIGMTESLMMRKSIFCVMVFWAACGFAQRSPVNLDFNDLYQAIKAEEQLVAKKYELAYAAYAKLADTTDDPHMAALANARAAVAHGMQENKYDEGLERARAVEDHAFSVQAQIELMAGHKDVQKVLDAFGDEDIASWPCRLLPQLPRVGRQDLRAVAFFDRGLAFLETGNGEAGTRDIERAYDFATARQHKLNLLSFLARNVYERTLKDADRTFQTDMRIIDLEAGYAATMHAMISAAGYLRDQERYDEALEILERGKWRNNTSRHWFTRGMKAVAETLAAAGKHDEAADAYRLIAEADDERTSGADRSWAALRLGRMLAAAGDADAARKVYAKLLEREEVGDEHRRQAETALAELTPSTEEAGW